MDRQRAEDLLGEERERLVALLEQASVNGAVEREGANEQGDLTDSAEPFTSEEENDAIAASLQERLEAVSLELVQRPVVPVVVEDALFKQELKVRLRLPGALGVGEAFPFYKIQLVHIVLASDLLLDFIVGYVYAR